MADGSRNAQRQADRWGVNLQRVARLWIVARSSQCGIFEQALAVQEAANAKSLRGSALPVYGYCVEPYPIHMQSKTYCNAHPLGATNGWLTRMDERESREHDKTDFLTSGPLEFVESSSPDSCTSFRLRDLTIRRSSVKHQSLEPLDGHVRCMTCVHTLGACMACGQRRIVPSSLDRSITIVESLQPAPDVLRVEFASSSDQKQVVDFAFFSLSATTESAARRSISH